MSTSHEDRYTFMIMSHSLLLKMKNVVNKIVEKIKTHILCSITFILKNHAIYKIMWKNIVELDMQQMTIWHMRFTCWILKAANTHSECVLLVVFHCSKCCMNALQCYVVCTLPVLLVHFCILIPRIFIIYQL
jgi:hypothetical protein